MADGSARRFLAVVGSIAAVFVTYEVATSFVACTDDAFVQADLVAVMAVPVVSGDPTQDRRQVIDRSLHRMLGCLLGGWPGWPASRCR